MQGAAVSLFEGDYAEFTANRLEESAYVLSQGDRADDAQACLAAARAFRELPCDQNPVAQALLEESLGSFLASLRDKEDKEEGVGEESEEALIVEP